MPTFFTVLGIIAIIAIFIAFVMVIINASRKKKLRSSLLRNRIWGMVFVAGLILLLLVVYFEPEPSTQPAPTLPQPPVVSMLDGATRFTGTLPPVADLSYTTREGDTLTIQGYPGLISLFVDPDTSRSVVEEKLKAFDAQVVGATPLAGLYLVQVTAGQEPTLTSALYSESWVLDSSPASPTAPAVMAALDFHTFYASSSNPSGQSHGEMVKRVMERSGGTVVAIDVDPPGTENDLPLSHIQAARVLEEMERAYAANERLVINISLQSLKSYRHQGSKDRTDCSEAYCQAIRDQQYIYYNSFLQAMEATFKNRPEVVDNAMITFVAGNAGVDLDSTIEKLREAAPNAIDHVKFVGGSDASGNVLQGFSHLKDTSKEGNRMVYARGEGVQIGGTLNAGTSFAGPEVARVLDLIWSQNPELTSVQLLEAFDKALAEMGTNNVLPQDENGLTTLAFINRVEILAKETPIASIPAPAPAPAPTPTLVPTPSLTTTPTTAITFTVPPELLPKATVGEPYSYSFTTATNPSGGNPPYTFILGSGVGFPPLGLVMDLNGTLSGTPTAEGTSTFEVCVKDLSGNQACGMTSLEIKPATAAGDWTGKYTVEGIGENRKDNFTARISEVGEFSFTIGEDGTTDVTGTGTGSARLVITGAVTGEASGDDIPLIVEGKYYDLLEKLYIKVYAKGTTDDGFYIWYDRTTPWAGGSDTVAYFPFSEGYGSFQLKGEDGEIGEKNKDDVEGWLDPGDSLLITIEIHKVK
ncbi:putative Ig domain-containing protein [Chloroflexota bacterium]